MTTDNQGKTYSTVLVDSIVADNDLVADGGNGLMVLSKHSGESNAYIEFGNNRRGFRLTHNAI